MNRIWDHLDTVTRMELAALWKLRCFWAKRGEVDELELEGPISIEEETEELAQLQKQPPKHPGGEGLGP